MYDIETLEEFLKFWINHGWIPSIKQDRVKQYLKQLEDLIKEYKELKEHLQKYYNGELFTAKQLKSIEENQRKYFIPKSKIKEKIEEYHHKDFIKVQVCYQHDNEARIKEEALKELLEGE